MIRRSHLIPALALAGLLAACSAADAPPPQPAPLEGAALGAPFTLTGEDGDPVSWSDFDGEYRTIYFGFTFCPDICPVDMQRAMAGLKRFEDVKPELGAKIQPLFVSVDPERDTPEALREFTDNFHPRLIGMTGSVEDLTQVAGDFGASFVKGEVQEDGSYLVGHSGLTLLFGPDGEPIATLPTDQGAEAVAEELAKWVR